jgi:hypothetical protein
MRLLGFILGGVLRYIGAEEALYPLGNINPKYKGRKKEFRKRKYLGSLVLRFPQTAQWAIETK